MKHFKYVPILFVMFYFFTITCQFPIIDFGAFRIHIFPNESKFQMIKTRIIQNRYSDLNSVFVYENFLDDKYSFSPYDVIYISSLCFPENIVEQIKQKANKQCKNNCHIFTSKGFNMDNGNVDNIKFLEQTTIPQSWIENSKLNVYKYEIDI